MVQVAYRPTTPRTRRVGALISSVFVGLIFVGTPPFSHPAAAGDTYPVPASGTWPINGAGFGHGIGLSQWGAQGAALQGLSYDQILGFYYPSTVLGYVGDRQIRVQLTSYVGSAIVFGSYGGEQLTATDRASGAAQALPSASRYVLGIDSNGMWLGSWTGQGWSPISLNGTYTFGGPVDISGPSGTWVYSPDLSGAGRQYWGTLRMVRTGSATAQAVNVLPLEAYLKAVVPREVPSSWHSSALRAQTVAARSYALAVSTPSQPWDICDTTQCQVYGGRAVAAVGGSVTWLEAPSTSAAVDQTGGVVVAYGNAVAFTQFSASNGGYSVQGSRPYLIARADPYSGAAPGDNSSRWTAQLSSSTLQAHCPSGGSLASFEITGRDGNGPFGGRITGIRVNCNTGSAMVTSSSSLRFGMKSNMWQPAVPPGASPSGHVDLVAAGVGNMRLRGWALDPDVTGPIEVHAYVDDGGRNLGPAALSRPDVAAAFPGYGDSHGFDVTIGASSGVHSVCVYAINVGTGANVALLCTSLTVSAHPAGNVERLAGTVGAIQVRGWALDPDVTGPIEVHAYVDGGGRNLGPAALQRPDVAAAFPGYGAGHGFDATIGAGSGAHNVCIYFINAGPGSNVLLSCTTVAVT